MKKFDVLIIGSGAVGAFVARNLSKYQLDVALLDKENDVGNMTSMANSAIVLIVYGNSSSLGMT